MITTPILIIITILVIKINNDVNINKCDVTIITMVPIIILTIANQSSLILAIKTK